MRTAREGRSVECHGAGAEVDVHELPHITATLLL